MDVGRAIKLCRTQRGLNQHELSTLTGISLGYVSLIEHGKRDPAFTTVEKIAAALDVPMVMLIFLASSDGEMSKLSKDLREKLAHEALAELSE